MALALIKDYGLANDEDENHTVQFQPVCPQILGAIAEQWYAIFQCLRCSEKQHIADINSAIARELEPYITCQRREPWPD